MASEVSLGSIIRQLLSFYLQNPLHFIIEVALGGFVLYLLLQKKYKPKKTPKLTEDEIDALIREWQPQPLAQELTEIQKLNAKVPVISSPPTAHVLIDGRSVLNLATSNYLGLVENPAIEDASQKALRKYGCGSCGPRGFYGTIDIHLDLEREIANFMGTEESIIYSSGFACITSAIPAFAKRGDLIFCDSGVHYAINTGLALSRATIKRFRHNDLDHLEKLLEELRQKDIKTKQKLNRRFVVVEGVYQNTGDIVPLRKLMQLKEKYCFRIFLDDSNGIGVLGKTGRGTCEHFGIPTTSVEIILSNMGCALASVGGFCAGNKIVVNHQRLNSSGYVFSASLPPYLAAAAIAAIDQIKASPEKLDALQENIQALRQGLGDVSPLQLTGDVHSPLFHLRLPQKSTQSTGDPEADRDALEKQRTSSEALLQKIVDKLLDEHSIAVSRAKYVPSDNNIPDPSIVLYVSAAHNKTELRTASNTIAKVVKEIL